MTEPELGQLLFTNSSIRDFEVPHYAKNDLSDLAERVARSRGDWQFGWGSLTSNSGADDYANKVFSMTSYCWCEGDGEHEDECPPNFEHLSSGLKINWYKHIGRGTTANLEIQRSVWRKIIDECLESVGFSEEQALAQAREESAKCSSCGKPQEELRVTAGFDGPDEVNSLKLRGTCMGCFYAQMRQYDQYIRESEEGTS